MGKEGKNEKGGSKRKQRERKSDLKKRNEKSQKGSNLGVRKKGGKKLAQVGKKDGFKFVILGDNFSGKANRKPY